MKYYHPVGIVQVYPAHSHHEPVIIIANWLALINLILMLLKALIRNQSEATVWASDGEGYGIMIKKVPPGWDTPVWKNLQNHYQADWISKNGISPYSLFDIKKES